MSADSARHETLKRLFESLCSLAPDERSALLDRECGADLEMRAELESMLAYDSDVEQVGGTSLLRGGIRATSRHLLTESEQPPEQIGGYQVHGCISTGGMGVVYEARQESPVRRRVAIKLIRGGLISAEAAARFDSERQALALMNHANVARLYEAGTTEQGRPYFAMEYVDGCPITEYCQRNGLTVNQRLLLFLDVCKGVQHAHQRGLIHRDIKPSNVLVERGADGKITPKIIDFGIAKATEQPLTARTRQTQLGQLVGTLEYMSPEQAGGSGLDVDTRTDVYSLGVMLYELLTGVHPLPGASLPKVGLEEILRLIREHEPVRPSSLASHLVARDLDWITLRAMSKERDRRYASVADFSEDIRRYQRHEPVTAGSPSRTYRLRKFVRRNRLAVAFGTSLAAVVLASVVGLTWQWRGAVASGEKARVAAARAERINDFLQGLLASAQPGAKGIDVTVRDVLDDAAKGLDEELQDEPEIQAAVRHTLGKTYYALGDYEPAEVQLQLALDLRHAGTRENTLEYAQNLEDLAEVYWRRREYSRAVELLRHGLQIRKDLLGEESDEVALSLHNIGATLSGLRQYAEADELLGRALKIRRKLHGNEHEEVATCLNSIAVSLIKQSRPEEAEPYAREASEMRGRLLGMGHPATFRAMGNLATILMSMGDPAGAEARMLEILEPQRETLGGDHPDVAMMLYNLGSAAVKTQSYDRAESYFRESMQIREARMGLVHPTSWYARHRLAGVCQEQGKIENAVGLYEEFVERGSLAKPPSPSSLILAEALLGKNLLVLDRVDEAEARLLHALETFRNHPNDGAPRDQLGKALESLYERLGQPEKFESIRAEL